MLVTTVTASPADAEAALLAGIEQRGLTLFARIDHAGAARDAGLAMPAEVVLVFGNPRGGTPLMLSDPRVGIELPLRILIWEADGQTMLGHDDPRALAKRYELAEQAAALEQLATLLGALVAETATAAG